MGCCEKPDASRTAFPIPVQGGVVTAVDEWEQALAETGRLTSSAVNQIIKIHGDRGKRAIEAVGEQRIKQYRDFIVVVGHEDEYVIEAGSCVCEDARYNLDSDDPTALCWHVIATKIAMAIDAIDQHDMWYSDVREFL